MGALFSSYWQAVKAQTSLGVNAVSPEPLLLTHGENDCCSDRNSDLEPYCVTLPLCLNQSTKNYVCLDITMRGHFTLYFIPLKFYLVNPKGRPQKLEVLAFYHLSCLTNNRS